MWGRLLDHSRAERLHVSAEDYPNHMLNPVPAGQVGALMRGRDLAGSRARAGVSDAGRSARKPMKPAAT